MMAPRDVPVGVRVTARAWGRAGLLCRRQSHPRLWSTARRCGCAASIPPTCDRSMRLVRRSHGRIAPALAHLLPFVVARRYCIRGIQHKRPYLQDTVQGGRGKRLQTAQLWHKCAAIILHCDINVAAGIAQINQPIRLPATRYGDKIAPPSMGVGAARRIVTRGFVQPQPKPHQWRGRSLDR
jgi:hypothetical protein